MNLEADIELLGRVPLFDGLNPDQLRLLAFSLVRTEFEPGAILFREGEKAGSAFILSFGTVELSTGEGAARRVIEECQRGYLIGELALFMPMRRPTTATATSVSSAVELSRPLFLRMLNEYPKVAALLHGRLSDRLHGTVTQLQRVRKALLAIGP